MQELRTSAELPLTTLKLLKAAKIASEITDRDKIQTVEIRDGWKGRGIFYFPRKTRYVAKCIELAGISELTTLFLFENTRQRVEKHFRPGIYDISGTDIKILK